MKTCTVCAETKPLNAYHKSKNSPDGFVSRCKECVAEYGKMWRAKNRDVICAKKREAYHADLKASRQASAKFRQKNPTYAKDWHAAHVEHDKAYKKNYTPPTRPACGTRGPRSEKMQAYLDANPSVHFTTPAEYKRTWYLANESRVKARVRRWAKEHPIERRDTELKRCAKKLAHWVEDVDRLTVFERDNWTCQLCGEAVDAALRFPNLMCATLDHKMPVSKGGEHSYANTQLAHFSCNSKKRDRYPEAGGDANDR